MGRKRMGNTLLSLSLSLFQKPSALLLFFARNSDVVARAIRAIYSEALFLCLDFLAPPEIWTLGRRDKNKGGRGGDRHQPKTAS